MKSMLLTMKTQRQEINNFLKFQKKRVNTQQDNQVFRKVIACIESIIQYKLLQIIGF